MTVQQVQGFVTVEPLSVITVVNSDIKRLFFVLNREIGGTAAESDTDRLIYFAIDNQICWHIDIGSVEGAELLVPVRIVESEIECTECLCVVEIGFSFGLGSATCFQIIVARCIGCHVAR